MLTLNDLYIKQAYYIQKRNEIAATDIETQVNIRLNELRDKITEEIKQEIEKDLAKCDNYIEVINELIKDEQTNTITDDQTAIASTDDTSIEETIEETTNVDINDDSEGGDICQ